MDIPASPLPPSVPDAKLWRAVVGDVVEALAPEGTGALAPPRRDAADAAAVPARPTRSDAPDVAVHRTASPAAPRRRPPDTVVLRSVDTSAAAPRAIDAPPAPDVHQAPQRSGTAPDPGNTAAPALPTWRPRPAEASPSPPAGAEPLPKPLRFAADAARASLAAGRPQPALALLDSAWPIATAPAELQALRAQGLLDLGRETEAAEVAARGLGLSPKSSALRWMGAQAAVRLEAPAHAAALVLPLLRQVPPPRDWDAEIEAVVLPDDATAADDEVVAEAGVPRRARESLKTLASAVVAMQRPSSPEKISEVPSDLPVPAVEASAARADAAPATDADADTPAEVPESADAEPAPAVKAAATRSVEPRSAAAAMEGAEWERVPPTAQPSKAMAPTEPVVPISEEGMPTEQAPDEAPRQQAAPRRTAAPAEMTQADAAPARGASLMAAPGPAPRVSEATPPEPQGSIAPTDAAPGPAPTPPRTQLFEQRRAAVLSALESTLGGPERRALVEGVVAAELERWLAPAPTRAPLDDAPIRAGQAFPVSAPEDALHGGAELGLLRISKDQFAIVPSQISQLSPSTPAAPGPSAIPEQLQGTAADLPAAPPIEGAAASRAAAAPPPLPEGGAGAEGAPRAAASEAAPVPDASQDRQAARIVVPPADPAVLFAWLAVDANMHAAGALAAPWRVAAEQVIIGRWAAGEAPWRTPMPVSWRGILHAGLVGAALVSLAAGRQGTAAVLGGAAALWWLRSARRR